MSTKVSLGPLEQKVIDVIWKCGPLTVKQVRQAVKRKRIAYTTVATILTRLEKKGLLEKKKKGLAYLYTPKISKESFTKKLTERILKRLINTYGDSAIASFVDAIEDLPRDKKKYFINLLKSHAKEE